MKTNDAYDNSSVNTSEEEVVDEILEEAGLEEAEIEFPQDDNPQDKELKEAKERIVRLLADFDNYRKRVQREKEDWLRYSSMGFVEKLLPVVDNLDRALENLNCQEEEVQGIFSGIAMIYRQFMEILQNEGMEPIEDIGQSFDPLVHEAVMQEPAEEGQEDNQIVVVMRKGYRFKDKLLRPAMVKVAKK
ncbi:MAG: nucleotide exchange factor GrpE [Firmicutes bacterium HGW-Firmicutes-12]|jgi:molecular chaperone GrpE|nr:MAG: nucleotide exchange factor GrpE [Firmicutes bacterium HGW-Firmicutes-12]